MTQEFAIAARDHGAGIAQQGHDGMAGRRHLPVVARDSADAEDHLRDFQLGGAVTRTVEGLQHAACARPLLTGQASIRRNGAAMQGGEKAGDRLQAVEAGYAERHHGNEGTGTRGCVDTEDLRLLGGVEVKQSVSVLPIGNRADIRKSRRIVGFRYQHVRSGSEDNDAGVLLWQPEDGGCWRRFEWVHREIVTPSAAGSCPSAVSGRHHPG